MDIVTYWNDVAQRCNQVAHTNEHPSEAGSRGPVGSSRSFAIVHLAIHDAYFGIVCLLPPLEPIYPPPAFRRLLPAPRPMRPYLRLPMPHCRRFIRTRSRHSMRRT